MSQVDQSLRKKWRRFVRRCGALPAAALLVLAGCTSGGLKQNDPFFGALGTPSPAPAGGSAATAQATASDVPPLPATHSLTSPAALAGGTTPTPESASNLRIPGGAPVVPASLPGNGAARGVAPSSGVQVGDPQPAPESSSSRSQAVAIPGSPPAVAAPPTSLPPPAGAPGTMTFESAQQLLNQRGVTWQRLELCSPGQWKFQCSLPIPGAKDMNRTFATDTPLPSDPLTAVRAVIDKIEKDQQR